MDTSAYVVLSRQLGLFRQMDVIANNVANASTNGFKSEQMLFTEYLMNSGSGQLKRSVSFSNDLATVRDKSQGQMTTTNRPLDAAINGEGYFVVDTPLGPRYTRVGNFTIDSQGQLVTPQGYALQGDGGPIVFDETDEKIVIREDGTVAAIIEGGIQEERGKLSVVKFDNDSFLREAGNGFYTSEEDPVTADEENYKVAQGILEGSNVNSVNELTNMIKVNRSVGLTSKFLSDVNELQRRAITVLSKQS